jgi:glyoxylase-like metal-dependent hydrolase (beta-lactamase superfamily II)
MAMADGVSDRGERRRTPLVYPIERPPDFGAAVEVAPGVLWARIPLGDALPAINVWAIGDGDGWTVIDTGMNTDRAGEAWRALFAGPLGGRPVTRVIVTHLHADHVGLAGWIARRFDCPLWMTEREYLRCLDHIADASRPAPASAVEFYRAAGWDESALAAYRTRFGWFGRLIHPLPDRYHRLKDGDQFAIGANVWRVVVGSGHSPEHACLYCPALKLFISGDQVLPRISSNVSLLPIEPQADPLADWLDSLAAIKRLVPDEVLVLPAHNEPFHGLHGRLDQLIRGHIRGLQRLERTLIEPKRAIDVFGALFARRIGPELLGLATGECLAHLTYLVRRGRLSAEADSDGIVWRRRTTEAGAPLQ